MHKTRNLFGAKWLKRGSGFLILCYFFVQIAIAFFSTAPFTKAIKLDPAANFSREPENRVQKVLYGASLAGNPILLAGTENSANGISWLILMIGSK